MAVVIAKWADNNLKLYGARLAALNEKFPKVLPRIVNQVGDRAKTQVIRNLTKQTGLPRKTIVKAIGDPSRAHAAAMRYEMITAGGNIRLKYLKAREVEGGVIAKPFGKTTMYPKAFMMGGAFPARKVVSNWDGHAFFRNRSSGRHYTFARSGVFIPTEMLGGQVKAQFLAEAAPLLKVRVDAALVKLGL